MDRNRPLIGICAYEVPAAFSHWTDVTTVMIPSGYTRSVHGAGGIPLVLPPFEDNTDLLDLLDGLVFSGGPDIGPDAYDAEPHVETTPVWPHRDRAEIALMRAALDRGVPVLGICRGMQLLNVVSGGSLQQHLADVLDDASPHKAAPGTFARHPVDIEPGTRLASILPHAPGAHSCHHQAPDRIGDGLTVSARAGDGVVEGLELPGPAFAVGVLWHPEEDPRDGAALFAARVFAAGEYRVSRAA
jgi:gamma-glutamyl-gamma-aminobutyrate hydrolase PuuD